MEKIGNVLEWPSDTKEAYRAFAIGLTDPRSPVSCLCQHTVRMIGRELITAVCYERMPTGVSMRLPDDWRGIFKERPHTVRALYGYFSDKHEIPSFCSQLSSFYAQPSKVLEENDCKFIAWDMIESREWSQDTVIRFMHNISGPLSLGKIEDPSEICDYVHYNSGMVVMHMIHPPPSYVYIFMIYVPLREIPLHALLSGTKPDNNFTWVLTWFSWFDYLKVDRKTETTTTPQQ